MESLLQYSSESEEESSTDQAVNTVKAETEEKESPEFNHQDSTFLPDPEFSLTALNIYSQNYQNQTGMSSSFLYLQWFPSLNTLKKLNKISNDAILHLKRANVAKLNQYKWKDVKKDDMGFHISIYPNIYGEEHKMKQFTENISSAVQNMRIDSKLVKISQEEVKRTEALNRILQRNGAAEGLAPKKYVTLGVSPYLSLFRSNTSNKLFLAVTIDKNQAAANFFKSLSSLINENRSLLDLSSATNFSSKLHVSIKVGEASFARLTDEELSVLQKSINSWPLDLNDIHVQVKDLTIYHLNQQKRFTHIPLQI